MASPHNPAFHTAAYNPPFRHSPHHTDPRQLRTGESPEKSHPVHPTFAAEIPRDIPRQGQYTPHERYAPPGVYDTSLHRAPEPYGTSPSQGQMYGVSPSQGQMYGTSPSQQQYLVPYPSHQGYPPPPQQQPYLGDQPMRTRSMSTASHTSHHSHRSHRSGGSHHSRHSKHSKSHRKNSRVESPRPSWSDSVILVWNSLKGAFDTRK